MYCPTCQTVYQTPSDAPQQCPTCASVAAGTHVSDAHVGTTSVHDMRGIQSTRSLVPWIIRPRAIVSAQPPERRSVAARAVHVPAMLWRQPVVRSAVRTGASAVALSVAVRVAGRWAARQDIFGRGASAAGGDAPLRALTDLLAPDPSAARPRRRHGVEVTEAVILLRRTVQH